MKCAVAEVAAISTATGPVGVELDPLSWCWSGESSDRTVCLRSRVRGCDVASLYFLVGRRPDGARPGESSLLALTDLSFIDPTGWKTVAGRTIPDWGADVEADGLSFEIDWSPSAVGISDGQATVPVLLEPVELGPTEAGTTYHADCVCLPSGDAAGRPLATTLLFREGVLAGMLRENPSRPGTGMEEVAPLPGDRFLFYQHLIERASEDLTSREGAQDAWAEPAVSASYLAGELVLGSHSFTVEEIPATPGRYMLGVVAEDTQGRLTESLAEVVLD